MHSWQGVPNPLLHKDPPIMPTPTPTLFKVCPISLPQSPSPQLFLMPFFFGWICYRTTFDVLFYLTILWIYILCLYVSTRRTLLCVLCNKASSLLRSDTIYVFLLAVWFDITHTKTLHYIDIIHWYQKFT